jgi:RNA polymerase sigma-70 factor, ECF subfamily
MIAGATQRWGTLLTAHSPMLKRYALRLAGNADDAEDLLQDAFITILCHRSGPADLEWSGAWCRGIVRNIAWRARRSRRRRGEVFVPDDGISEIAEHHVDWENTLAERQLLANELSKAGDEALELLYRRYWLGESSTDIASALKQTPAGIRMKLKRVRNAIARSEPGTPRVSIADRGSASSPS